MPLDPIREIRNKTIKPLILYSLEIIPSPALPLILVLNIHQPMVPRGQYRYRMERLYNELLLKQDYHIEEQRNYWIYITIIQLYHILIDLIMFQLSLKNYRSYALWKE